MQKYMYILNVYLYTCGPFVANWIVWFGSVDCLILIPTKCVMHFSIIVGTGLDGLSFKMSLGVINSGSMVFFWPFTFFRFYRPSPFRFNFREIWCTAFFPFYWAFCCFCALQVTILHCAVTFITKFWWMYFVNILLKASWNADWRPERFSFTR